MKLTEIFINGNLESLLQQLDVLAPLVSYDIKVRLENIEKGEDSKSQIRRICANLVECILANPNVASLFDYTEAEIEEIRTCCVEDTFDFISMVAEKVILNNTPIVKSDVELVQDVIGFVTQNTMFELKNQNTERQATFVIEDNLYDTNDNDTLISAVQQIIPNANVSVEPFKSSIYLNVDVPTPINAPTFSGSQLMGCEVSIESDTNEIFFGKVTYVANNTIEGYLEVGSTISTKNVSVNIADSDGIPRRGIVVEVIEIV